MKKTLILLGALLLLSTVLYADVAIKSGASSTTLTVNSNNAALVVEGLSSRATYIASTSGNATTAAHTLSIEASSTLGFKLMGWCVSTSNATTAAAGTITVQRRTTA